jgi:hypothetical protein
MLSSQSAYVLEPLHLGDDDDLNDAENWNLQFACDCGFSILFYRCMSLSDDERIPRSPHDWQSMTQRMNQSAIRNLLIAGDREAVWFGHPICDSA